MFLRPDEDIAADARRVLNDVLVAEPGEAEVAVRNGVVTLTGTLDPKTGPHGDLIPVAIQLMWDVNGVVDVIDQLGEESRKALHRLTSRSRNSGVTPCSDQATRPRALPTCPLGLRSSCGADPDGRKER